MSTLKTPHWHVGANIPGYMPEGDVAGTAVWEDAYGAFRDEIVRYQDEWADRCTESHESEAEQGDCLAGGEYRCKWHELWVEAQADWLGEREAGVWWDTFVYRTPEGPDIAIFMTPCSEVECEATWED